MKVHFLILLTIVLLHVHPCSAMEAPRNPNSAKECAICHYRWVDTFFIDGRDSELVPYQQEPVVATAGMCHSCHDGSVVDSRANVYNDRHHQTGRPPPPEMKIPKIFPLDKNGFMECSTCHTAHGTSGEASIERAVFMRTSNKDSAMCMMCHVSKAGGTAKGNHPINISDPKITAEIQSLGSRVGAYPNLEQDKMICETCHTPHGSLYESFLVKSAKNSSLCLLCHKDKAQVINSAHDLHQRAPDAVNSQGKTIFESGICGACHLVHGGGTTRLWARSKKAAGRGGETFCRDCHSDNGPASKKQLADGHNHPYNVTLAQSGLTTTLPLYNNKGKVDPNGMVVCETCHDPHNWKPDKIQVAHPSSKLKPRSGNSFLRIENHQSSKLCANCHKKQALLVGSDHDLRITAPTSRNIFDETPDQSGICAVCHNVHGGGADALWSRTAKGTDRGRYMCESCHHKDGEAEKKVIHAPAHPTNISLAEKGLTTKLPLFNEKGEKDPKGNMTCLTCHDPHQWDPVAARSGSGKNIEGDSRNSFLRLENSPRPKLCADCHQKQGVVAGTDHDLQVTADDSHNLIGQTPAESGPCGACHAVHNGKNELLLWARSFGDGDGVQDKMCNSCHSPEGLGAKKIPRIATHPSEKLVTNVGRNREDKVNFFPLFDKKTGKPVHVGDIACASCHNVHQWNPTVLAPGPEVNLEGKATDSFLRHRASNTVCADCHGFDALFRYKYYHDPKNRSPQKAVR